MWMKLESIDNVYSVSGVIQYSLNYVLPSHETTSYILRHPVYDTE